MPDTGREPVPMMSEVRAHPVMVLRPEPRPEPLRHDPVMREPTSVCDTMPNDGRSLRCPLSLRRYLVVGDFALTVNDCVRLVRQLPLVRELPLVRQVFLVLQLPLVMQVVVVTLFVLVRLVLFLLAMVRMLDVHVEPVPNVVTTPSHA